MREPRTQCPPARPAASRWIGSRSQWGRESWARGRRRWRAPDEEGGRGVRQSGVGKGCGKWCGKGWGMGCSKGCGMGQGAWGAYQLNTAVPYPSGAYPTQAVRTSYTYYGAYQLYVLWRVPAPMRPRSCWRGLGSVRPRVAVAARATRDRVGTRRHTYQVRAVVSIAMVS